MSTLQNAVYLQVPIYAGGPGSGCDPDAAKKKGNKCGRPSLGRRAKEAKRKGYGILIKGERKPADIARARRHVRTMQRARKELEAAPDNDARIARAKESVEDGLSYLWREVEDGVLTPASVDAVINAHDAYVEGKYVRALSWVAAGVGILLLPTGWFLKPLKVVGKRAGKLIAKGLNTPAGRKLLQKTLKQARRVNSRIKKALKIGQRTAPRRRKKKTATRRRRRTGVRPQTGLIQPEFL